MSWSIIVGRWPVAAGSLRDLPAGWEPPPLMSRAELASRIRAAVPEAEFGESFRGEVLGPGFTVEIDLGGEDPARTLTIVLHRDSARAGVVAAAIIDGLGLRGIDEAGEPFDTAAAAAKARRVAGDAPAGRPTVEGPSEVERLLGVTFDRERWVPGTRLGESQTVRYVALLATEVPRRAFRRVTTQLQPPLPTHGAVISEPCLLTLPDGTRLFGLSYHGDVDGWRAQLEWAADEQGRVCALIDREDLVLSDGRRIPLADCGVQLG